MPRGGPRPGAGRPKGRAWRVSAALEARVNEIRAEAPRATMYEALATLAGDEREQTAVRLQAARALSRAATTGCLPRGPVKRAKRSSSRDHETPPAAHWIVAARLIEDYARAMQAEKGLSLVEAVFLLANDPTADPALRLAAMRYFFGAFFGVVISQIRNGGPGNAKTVGK